MSKKKVLVFPAGSEIGLEIHKSLRFSKHFELIGASSVSDHGAFVYENHIEGVPFVDDETFIDSINDIIKSESIDYIFPAHDSVVLKLAQNQKHIEAIVVTSPSITTEISRSKSRTYAVLKDTVRTPVLYNDSSLINEFPVFLKPDVGQGSKGTLRANNLNDIYQATLNDPTLLIMEYLPGDEYTVDCFTDSEGVLLYSQARKRARIQNGISVNSKSVIGDEFVQFASKINKEIKFNGAWFFQVKRDKSGQLCLMEIAPRIAGTMALSRISGVNLPLLSLYQQEGVKVSIIQNKIGVEIDRALSNMYRFDKPIDTVYVDFDDTIVFEDKVNPFVIGFLYKASGIGIKIVLITKHAGDIYKTLSKYKIAENLFDSIVHLDALEEKKIHIEGDSIFIDDSYAERHAISKELNIPVFDSTEITEMLDGGIL